MPTVLTDAFGPVLAVLCFVTLVVGSGAAAPGRRRRQQKLDQTVEAPPEAIRKERTPPAPASTDTRKHRPSVAPTTQRADAVIDSGLADKRDTGLGFPGTLLHQGNHGRIWDLEGFERQVFREPGRRGGPDLATFTRLVCAGRDVRKSLDDNAFPIDMCWPTEIVTIGETVGVLAPRIADRFFYRVGTRSVLRTLDMALRSSPPPDVGDQVRLELVRLVGEFLMALHARGLVYGDVRWSNFAFTGAQCSHLSVHDFTSTRRLGDLALGSATPLGPQRVLVGAPVSTFDGDRYRFAQIAYGLLVSGNPSSPLDPAATPANSSVLGVPTRRWQTLIRRATGAAGTRPQIGEWLDVLE